MQNNNVYRSAISTSYRIMGEKVRVGKSSVKPFERINLAKKPLLGSNFCNTRTSNSFTFPENRSSQAATKICCGKKVFS